MEDASRGKLSLIEGADGHQDGNSAPKEKELPPEKRYRAALLKNRFADIILKAQEITLNQVSCVCGGVSCYIWLALPL
jgi:hypothetical protein